MDVLFSFKVEKNSSQKKSNELLAGQLEFICEIRFAEQIDE